ncbi:MAG: sensor histidine kinase [Polyangiaceae bacterium]|jgi:two-component system, LytTR family, sensor kinase
MAALTTKAPSRAHATAATRAAIPLPLKGALIFGAWTLVGVFGLLEGMLRGYVSGHRELLHAAACFQCVWQWALFTPIIFALSARFPIERRRWLLTLPLHLVFMFGFAVLDVVTDYVLSPWVDPSITSSITKRFSEEFFMNVLNYFAVLSVGHALRFYALSHQRLLEASRLQGELLRARLTALEMRLQPHFLYNTLHSIAALVRVQRGPEAISMIAGLGDLLRDVLDSDGAVEVPLHRELDLARRYLAIEQIRFGDRLQVRVNAEPAVMDAMVPTLLLQPIVENAVRHGIEADPDASLVEIDARRDGGTLTLQVHDDGHCAHPRDGADGPRVRDGIGLGTTRERLREMFGDDCSVSLTSGERGDVTTTVRLPLRRQNEGEGGRGP